MLDRVRQERRLVGLIVVSSMALLLGFATAGAIYQLNFSLALSAPLALIAALFLRLRRPGIVPKTLASTSVLIVGLNLLAPAKPSIPTRLLASIGVAIVGIVYMKWKEGADNRPPILPVVCALYAVYFFLPIFLRKRYSLHTTDPVLILRSDMQRALLLSVVGLMLFVAGWALIQVLNQSEARSSPIDGSTASAPMPPPTFWVIFGLIGSVIYILVSSGSLSPGLAEPASQIASLSLVASLSLYYFIRRSDMPHPGLTGFFFGLVGLRLVAGLGTTFLHEVAVVVVALLTMSVLVKRRIPVLVVVVCVIGVLYAQAAKEDARLTNTAQGSLFQSASHFAHAAAGGASASDSPSDLVDGLAARVGFLTTLGNVTARTPSQIPYWDGHTYVQIPAQFVPRLVYPEKPSQTSAKEFGYRYSFVPGGVDITYGMPQLVELYVNFGPAGVLIGSFLLGALLAWAERFCRRRITPALGIPASVYLLLQLGDPGQPLAFVMAKFLYGVVILLGVAQMAKLTSRSTAPPV